MATIYTAYDSFGLVGRCDARCHNAKGSECRCICGGAFHGVGSRIAQEDAHHLTDEDLVENIRAMGFKMPVRIYRHEQHRWLFKM